MINRNQPRSTGIHMARTQRKTNQSSQSQMSTLSRFIVGAARLMLVRREMRYSTMQAGIGVLASSLVIARQQFVFERQTPAHHRAQAAGCAPIAAVAAITGSLKNRFADCCQN